MKKLILLLFICSPFFGFSQTNLEQDSVTTENSDSEKCNIKSCWGHGTLDESKCACDCNEGFIGKECDQLDFSNGNSLQFDTYLIDFAELAGSENIVLKDGVKYIKKNSVPLVHTIKVKNTTNKKITIFGKTRTGRGYLRFTEGVEIPPNSEIPVEVMYSYNGPKEKLEWITFNDGTDKYKIMVKLRIAD